MAIAATTNMCLDNCTNAGTLYEFGSDDIWARWNAIAYYFDYQPWIFSLIGSAMVGLSGVLPLLIIPIDEGANLKNGAGAGTLKILLSFAVGGLLGDVFLHLLPEAWASKTLNIVEANGQRPMACGLWVLTGFLVFIIAEKLFIGEGEEADESDKDHEEINSISDAREKPQEFTNNNVHKELDNNNCLTLNGTANVLSSELKYSKEVQDRESTMIDKKRLNETKNGYSIQKIGETSQKNGFTKKSSIINDSRLEERRPSIISLQRERANGFSKIIHRANGSAKIATNFHNERASSVENTRVNTQRDEKTRSKVDANEKPKAKHISGYLNLMANCIDNFTHGLAVGGSFLVSFRLGALTTFAILIHEIPHEVGDFAILLKSGFSRWDAARAQLLTASGGIFGALVAVLCSGSGIESRTSWILPFTAGGFLHIGMVTVLPELLKETNPKESMKQLGALLSGITVMAVLTILCD